MALVRFDDEDRWTDVKVEVIRYIVANFHRFRNNLIIAHNKLFIFPARYVAHIQLPNTWASDVELCAFCDLYGYGMLLFNSVINDERGSRDFRVKLSRNMVGTDFPFFLARFKNGNHFQLMRTCSSDLQGNVILGLDVIRRNLGEVPLFTPRAHSFQSLVDCGLLPNVPSVQGYIARLVNQELHTPPRTDLPNAPEVIIITDEDPVEGQNKPPKRVKTRFSTRLKENSSLRPKRVVKQLNFGRKVSAKEPQLETPPTKERVNRRKRVFKTVPLEDEFEGGHPSGQTCVDGLTFSETTVVVEVSWEEEVFKAYQEQAKSVNVAFPYATFAGSQDAFFGKPSVKAFSGIFAVGPRFYF